MFGTLSLDEESDSDDEMIGPEDEEEEGEGFLREEVNNLINNMLDQSKGSRAKKVP